MNKNRIAVVDLGGQYAHLICQKVNKLGADGYIVSDPEFVKDDLRPETFGIILSGGPNSVYDKDSPKVAEDVFLSNLPILGICYGHQLMTHILGGTVSKGSVKEYGTAKLKITTTDTVFKGIENDSQTVWMSHGDSVKRLPPGFEILAKTKDCEHAAIGNLKKRLFGVQFHPEVSHTTCGDKILENFIFGICQCVKKNRRISDIPNIKENIKNVVKDKNVFFLVSGGVDSTVAFTLCTASLGNKRVRGLCIDTGMMRKDEIKSIKKTYKAIGLNNVDFVDRSDIFINSLKYVYDPEKKRKIIGEKFVEVQNRYLNHNKINAKEWMLGQGTIYPDTIESGGTKHSSLIKTHHNRVGAIEQLKEAGMLVEPISSYYKDEVRELALELSLPESIVNRNPFPGPGLAIRCLASNQNFDLLTKLKNIKRFIPYKNTRAWQIPHKTVGVQGDKRSENYAVVLEGDIPYSNLERISTDITNNLMTINRVNYLIGSKKPMKDARIVKSEITKERLDVLREADHMVHQYFSEKPIFKDIWQFPVIIIPMQFENGETIVLRPVSSINGMTASFTKIPKSQIEEVTQKLLKIPGIDAVLFDITNKPPATIEWE